MSTRRNVPVHMSEPHWALLERYERSINTKLRERGLEPVSTGRLIGAIVSAMLTPHGKEILEAKAAGHLEGVRGRTPARLLEDLLDPKRDR